MVDGPGSTLLAATRSSFSELKNARLDRAADDRERHAHLDGVADGPFAGALLTGLVEDDIDERLAGFGVFLAENVRGDLDQEAVELALVPLAEDLAQTPPRSD